MKPKIQISKLDAAKRQLETAVKLYFNDLDPVSIHTLSFAAHSILSDLNKKSSGTPFILDFINLVKKEYRSEVRKKVNNAKNFFKHADRDPYSNIEFYVELNEFILFDACEGYQILTNEKVPPFIIYRGWFNYIHPIVDYKDNRREILKNEYGNNKLKFYTELLAGSGIIK